MPVLIVCMFVSAFVGAFVWLNYISNEIHVHTKQKHGRKNNPFHN